MYMRCTFIFIDIYYTHHIEFTEFARLFGVRLAYWFTYKSEEGKFGTFLLFRTLTPSNGYDDALTDYY